MEWGDFQTQWEQRLLEIAMPFLDPEPELVEGSGLATFKPGVTLTVIVSPGQENPPRSGYYQSEIIAEYDYGSNETQENVSRQWGQILEAFGNGKNGDSPLRNRISSGQLKVPGGVDAILYDRQIAQDDGAGVKQFAFSAHLGILQPN